jgi:stage II sporulation protein E
LKLQARKGDEIIIVSDGITEADRADGQMEWIRETIENIRSRDPQTMSDLIINKAVERYGLKEKDDMTVITAIIT